MLSAKIDFAIEKKKKKIVILFFFTFTQTLFDQNIHTIFFLKLSPEKG